MDEPSTTTVLRAADLADRRARFAARVAAHDVLVPGYEQVWGWWRDRLLAVGGVEVVPPAEPECDIASLLCTATRMDAVDVCSEPGRPSACHENVAELVAAGRTRCGRIVATACTGYALSGDGLWRQHSWARTDDGTTVETTESRVAYVGFERPGVPAG